MTEQTPGDQKEDQEVQQPQEPKQEPAAAEPAEPAKEDKPKQEAKQDYAIKPQNVHRKYKVFLEVGKFDEEKGVIALPSSFTDYTFAKVTSGPNVSLEDTTKSSHWGEVVREGIKLTANEEVYRQALENTEAQWEQAIESNGKDLIASSPQLGKASAESMTGERAALRLLRYAGYGSIFMLPLWHTGIWLTLKAPSEARLLEINREMMNNKIALGRQTYGTGLSAVSSVFTEKILKLAIEHLYICNLKTDKSLLDIISVNDIPTVMWGLACVIWNNGFQYERGCTHDPEKCQHIEKELLDLTKLLWVNKTALTPWQISHMARKKSGEITQEDVDRYKKEFLSQQPRRIEIPGANGSNFFIDLRVPTAAEYIEQSNDWLDSIAQNVEDALQADASSEQRNRYVIELGRATYMRQYAHWVASISFGDETIEDRETIYAMLDQLSGQYEVYTAFVDAAKKYMRDTVVSVIGIPTYECSKCHGKQKFEPMSSSTEGIIPLDIMQTFFYLLVQKMRQIYQR